MHYLVIATKLRILVLDRVEAVRAGSDNGTVLGGHASRTVAVAIVPAAIMISGGIESVTIEHLDVLLGHHLPEIFVAYTSRRVARTGLFGSQDGEVDASGQQHFRHGGCYLLVTPIKGAHATNPVENIGIGIFRHQGDAEVSSPLGPFIVAYFPGIRVALDIVEERGHLRREVAFFHDQVAAHIDDLRHMLDGDRAYLHAGSAGGAGPQGVIRNDAADHRLVMCADLFFCFIGSDARDAQPAIERIHSQNFIALHKERFFDAEDDFLGEEWFASVGGGADRIAAAALGTSIAVK